MQTKEKKLTKDLNSQLINIFTETVGMNYMVCDAEGNFVIKNKQVMGLTKNAKKISDVDPKAWTNCLEVLQTGKRSMIEEKYKNKYFLTIKQPVFVKSKIEGLIIVSIDITDKKKDQIAKEAFIGQMSHDIQTPFMGLRVLSSALATEEKDVDKKNKLNMILETSNNLLDYINKLLDASENLIEKREIKNFNFNIKKSVKYIVDMVNPSCCTKNIKLIFNSPDKVIHFKKIAFEQILLNLVTNAVKFTEEGTILIDVSIENKLLTTSITDTGIGIDKKNHDIIFKKFKRVVPSDLQSKYKGSGLGLDIVKRLLKRVKGDISLKSSLNNGSTFTFTMPIKTF